MKRAADLVEALYGMPHNNQVKTNDTLFPFTLILCITLNLRDICVVKDPLRSYFP